MSLLSYDEFINVYYKPAVNMPADQVELYLVRANTYCKGCLGGEPGINDISVDDWKDVKTAVAMAFEIMTDGKTATVDPVTGNITEIAPSGEFIKGATNPLLIVKEMLRHVAAKIAENPKIESDRGIRFL